MNIYEIINEEFDGFLNELVPTEREVFPYEKANSIGTEYEIKIDLPEKGINAIMVVYFSPIGDASDKAYSISFKERNGSWGDRTGFGVQFKLLATISKIVKELTVTHDPNILGFAPVQKAATGNKHTSPHQRLKLYMEYVKAGAGEDFDAFILGDSYAVTVEKKNPSFPLENGYIDRETIQDIITQLSVYMGSYETDLPKDSPEYAKFIMSMYGGGTMYTPHGSKTTISMRRFVDWIFSTEFVEYVHGSKEPQQVTSPSRQAQPQQGRTDAPIQRVTRHSVSGDNVGDATTFIQFLETNVYGNSTYDVLDPYFETMKSLGDFEELKNRANLSLANARTTADRERLLAIIDAVDTIKNSFHNYTRDNSNVNEILNEILTEVNNLIR